MKSALLLSSLLLSSTLSAIQVDPVNGNDSNDGVAAPVKTIARGIKLAQPGDTVHLAKATYHESVVLTAKHGLPGKPVTVDGHGSIIEGSEPVRAADWEALGEGLFRKVKLLPRMDPAILGRWFFLWNGRMNHMGRTSKGPSLPLKKVADLQPDEWTYVQEEDAFYVKLPAGQRLDAANLRYPLRSSGVVLSGSGAHLVVRNITCTHVYNDGFNIHGDQVDTVFENIAAIDCGDDGFSAHETAECRVDGFVSMGNSTGLCDTVSSVTHFKNVYISGCLGYDIFFIGDSPHSMENVLVDSSAAYPLSIAQHTDRPQSGLSRVSLKNVLIRRMPGKAGDIRVTRNSVLVAENCTFAGMSLMITPGAEVNLTKSVIKGGAGKPDILIFDETVWKGAGNRYDLKSLRKGAEFFTAATFADFQSKVGSEEGSKWTVDLPVEAGIGADEAGLERLKPGK